MSADCSLQVVESQHRSGDLILANDSISKIYWRCQKRAISRRQRSAVRGYWSRPSQLEGPLAGILGVMTKRNKINIQATSAGFCVF